MGVKIGKCLVGVVLVVLLVSVEVSRAQLVGPLISKETCSLKDGSLCSGQDTTETKREFEIKGEIIAGGVEDATEAPNVILVESPSVGQFQETDYQQNEKPEEEKSIEDKPEVHDHQHGEHSHTQQSDQALPSYQPHLPDQSDFQDSSQPNLSKTPDQLHADVLSSQSPSSPDESVQYNLSGDSPQDTSYVESSKSPELVDLQEPTLPQSTAEESVSLGDTPTPSPEELVQSSGEPIATLEVSQQPFEQVIQPPEEFTPSPFESVTASEEPTEYISERQAVGESSQTPEEQSDIGLTGDGDPSNSHQTEESVQTNVDTEIQTDDIEISPQPELTEEVNNIHQHEDVPQEHNHVYQHGQSSEESIHVHESDHSHEQDHDHHHHHHRHNHDFLKITNETSSVMLVIKHLSSTLLSFLPEPLQDTILDVDDALVLTGIIALTLVSICVPYFLIEGYMSVRPLKKKVVELNKSLWKVSAAYETQQEEFEQYKQKAIAHDDFKKRAEQSENDVIILKKLETKHREQITTLKTQLKSQMKEAVDIRALIEKTLADKKTVSDECAKYKTAYETTKDALVKAREELTNFQTHAKSTALQLGMSSKNAGVLTSKISILEEETEEIKSQLSAEFEKRKLVESEKQKVEEEKVSIEKELTEIKKICHQYEETVTGLNDEISKLESELVSIKESLGEDSPLLEVAEIQAKAAFSEKEVESLRTRLEGLTSDNDNLRGKLNETKAELEAARGEREQTNNRLTVLEAYFKEREEEYIKTIDQLQLKESVRDKGKEELIRIIEEKDNVCKDLNERLEALKEEFEETKQQHRNEIRALEAKSHENWLSLCQAERKAQDARKEGELLRQRLLALQKEKDEDDGDGLNGEVPVFPVIPHELVPLPLMDEPPSYFGLGDFEPPPPLPEGEEREPHRPPPLGGRLSPSFSDDDNIISPIRGGRRDDDCTDGSSGSDSPRRSPPFRGGWVNVQNERGGHSVENVRRMARATSSPIQPGANL